MTTRVDLDFKVHWCAKHLEPFRANWPEGAGVAMVALFDAAFADQRIIDAAPKDADGQAKTSSLNAVLREHSPLCCFNADEALEAIYAKAGKEPPE